jgi:hypothetical protein
MTLGDLQLQTGFVIRRTAVYQPSGLGSAVAVKSTNPSHATAKMAPHLAYVTQNRNADKPRVPRPLINSTSQPAHRLIETTGMNDRFFRYIRASYPLAYEGRT